MRIAVFLFVVAAVIALSAPHLSKGERLPAPPQHGHSYALRVWPHSHQQSPSLAAHGLRTMISSVPRSFRHLELILGFALRVMPEQALRLLTTWRADETSDFQWKLVPGAGLEPTRPLRDPGF